MSNGFFRVKKITDLNTAKEGDIFHESDFSCIVGDNKFLQMEYVEEEQLEKYVVKPGLWKIVKTSRDMRLVKAEFSKDKILEDFVNTKELENKIDCFFRNLNEYKILGKDVPKRAALIWGPPGTGKTANSIHCANKYINQYNDIAVVIWNTDAVDPFEVKMFFQTFEYEGVNKLILIAEDLGGIEIDQARIKSLSSLLSLLDNKEKTFTIPVFIIATTNFPANFLGNITNRPERFDDKIHVDNPTSAQRKELLTFFLRNFQDKYSQDEINEVCKLITKDMYKEFSIAHIQEIVVRSRIYEQSLITSLNAVKKDIDLFLKEFQKDKKQLGIISDDDY